MGLLVMIIGSVICSVSSERGKILLITGLRGSNDAEKDGISVVDALESDELSVELGIKSEGIGSILY